MRTKVFTAMVAATALATLLQPVAATADGPVPGLPAPPNASDISVTPSAGEGGIGIDVGVGETVLQIGAGPGGVSLGVRPRGSAARPPGADAGVPVGIPRDRPGRSGIAGTGGRGGLLFASPTPGGAAGAGRGDAGRREASHGRRAGGAAHRTDSHRPKPASKRTGRRSLPPFIEFIDRIPTAVKVGLFALALMALAVWAAWVRERRRLERNAFVDPVTGIANEPAFDGLLERELERAKRYKRPLALLVLDVSEAVHGRLLQDQRLRAVTAAIRERAREGDIFARTGPSQFAVISPEATAASADTLARALELRLEEMRLHVIVAAVERQPTDLSAKQMRARAEATIAAREAARERRRSRPLMRVA
jgi:diguanylate cyclase (GGDEF)-like protein